MIIPSNLRTIPFELETLEECRICLKMDKRLIDYVRNNFCLTDVTVMPLNKIELLVADSSGKISILTLKGRRVDCYEEKLALVEDEHDMEMEP